MWVLRRADADASPPRIFRLLPGSLKTVGRARRVDFTVEAAMVSRVHCRLRVDAEGQLEVEDLDSTNGTFVNERRVSRAVLVPGDRLRIGRAEFVVDLDRAGSSSPS